jgi:uncharacterized protein (TIGR00299 family) protein
VSGDWLHIECPAGIAGDMFVGAALDLGVPLSVVESAVAKLALDLRLTVREVRRGSLVGKLVEVVGGEEPDRPHAHDHDGHRHGPHPHAHRPYRDIQRLLARLPSGVERRARDIFDRIALVEARLHGVTPDEVEFHEVGALDSIFDVVAAAAALEHLAPARVTCARVALGSGRVKTRHGLLPVPAPATAALLVGAPVESGGAAVELTTPTGAAILAATVTAWVELPPMTLGAVGYGAGQRELDDRPNLVRLLCGRPRAAVAEAHECLVLEANVDDMTPQLAEPLMEALFAAGALDVWFTPIHMKKNRPAFQVGALAPAAEGPGVAAALLAESTTLGVRSHAVSRTTLERRMAEVDTPFGQVTIKLGLRDGRVVNVAPEYDSVRRVAAARGVPAKQVYAAALAAAAGLSS